MAYSVRFLFIVIAIAAVLIRFLVALPQEVRPAAAVGLWFVFCILAFILSDKLQSRMSRRRNY